MNNRLIVRAVFMICTGIILPSCGSDKPAEVRYSGPFPGSITVPALPFAPRQYICYKAGVTITVDGEINDNEWSSAPWSEPFTDIEGDLKPAPLHQTRMKMLWDERYLYIAAEITEPHIWAKLRQRDTVIYYDNDFEVFIDPDGDTHGYYEFEMNAFNTVWDLLLTAPYRDNGRVIDAWNINGLKSAVRLYGTINDPADEDDKWTVELALPFDVLTEWGSMPADGDCWRMNFSRVNWRTKIENGHYVKETDTVTGKALPEFNWLWSPQGLVNVHYPEMWGFVQFRESTSGGNSDSLTIHPDEYVKWELRRLYYAQRSYAEKNNSFASDAGELEAFGYSYSTIKPGIIITMSGYEAFLPGTEGDVTVCINNRGKTWSLQEGTKPH